jgi:hypothetical protein
MWILKGILLGFGIFVIGSLVYVGAKLRPFEEHKATGISAITGVTLYNPWWWVILVVILALACCFVRPKA